MRRLVVALVVVAACKKEPVPAPPAPAPVVVTQPLVSASAPAPPSAPVRDCHPGPRLRAALGPPQRDCGRVERRHVEKDLVAPRKCVRDAIAAKASFQLVIAMQGIDSVVEYGFGGARPDGGPYELYALHYDGCPMGCGDGAPSSTLNRCAELALEKAPYEACIGQSYVDECSTPYPRDQ